MGHGDEPADRPPVRPRDSAVRSCSSPSPRAGPSSKPPRCAKTRTTIARSSSSSASPAARSSPPTGPCSPKREGPRRHLPAHLPVGRAVRAGDRLLLHRPGPRERRARALPQRASSSGQTGTTSRVDPRSAPGQEADGDKVDHDAEPARPAGRVGGARRPRRGASWRSNPKTGAVTVMASRPSFDPNALAPGRQRAVDRARRRQPAGQPRHPVRLRAGLDLQGRDRDRRDRHRALHAPNRSSAAATPILVSGLPLGNDDGKSYGELTLSDALTNSINTGLGAGRRKGRQADAADLHGTPRLLQHAARSTSQRRDVASAASTRANGCCDRRARRWTSGGWASARTDSRPRRCRWPRWPPRWPNTAR